MAAAERPAQVATVEPGEVHLHLVRRTGQGRDRGEVLACALRQLVDQSWKLADREPLHAPLGARHCRPVARLQVLAPLLLEDRHAVPDRRRDQPCEAAGEPEEVPEQARQAADDGPAGEPVDRVEVPAVDDDVVGPRSALPDPPPELRVQAVFHRG